MKLINATIFFGIFFTAVTLAGCNSADFNSDSVEDTYPLPDKAIAISFDDGPSGVTEDLLAVLAEHKVKATFFLIGQNIRNNKSKVQAIFDGGHELGNHSDGYASLGGNVEEETIRTSLKAASSALKEITGEDPLFFRAPNVDYGDNLSAVCGELGLAIIGVSCWSDDWRDDVATERLVNNVLSRASDGAIINCHELRKTVDGIPAIIHGLRMKGYEILSVGELAERKNKTLNAGERYDRIY